MRQAVHGRFRLAGDEAERLARDPAVRTIVGREGLDRPSASSGGMGRFGTEWPATESDLAAPADPSGAWIDRVHWRRPPDDVILGMGSSGSPTFGQRKGSAWNGRFRVGRPPPASGSGLAPPTLPVIAPQAGLPVDDRPFEGHRRTR